MYLTYRLIIIGQGQSSGVCMYCQQGYLLVADIGVSLEGTIVIRDYHHENIQVCLISYN